MKARVIVEFKDFGEAARWLAAFSSPHTPGLKLLRQEMTQCGELSEYPDVGAFAIARAAVAVLTERFGPSLKSLEEEVRVLREELEKARADAARLTGAEPSGVPGEVV